MNILPSTLLLVALCGLLFSSTVFAEPTAESTPAEKKSPKNSAEADNPGEPAPLDPSVSPKASPSEKDLALEKQASEQRVLSETIDRILALREGDLDPAVDPEVLFGFPPRDRELVKKELVRIRAALASTNPSAVEGSENEAPTGNALQTQPATTPAENDKDQEPPAAPPGVGAEENGPVTAEENDKAEATKPLSLRQKTVRRLEQTKLEFFTLPQQERDQILSDHQKRREEYLAELDGVSAAKQRAEDAERERQQAIEAARIARTEAERLVAEERARLLNIQRLQAETEGLLSEKRKAIVLREEEHLKLQRRVREFLASDLNEEAAAVLFLECEDSAAEVQKAFFAALGRSALKIPSPGDDPLEALELQVDTEAIKQLRRRLESETRRLERAAEDVLWQGRAQLYRELRDTSVARLDLLRLIPAERRSDILSLSPSGFAQAAIELRQVLLILRYHTQLTTHWVDTLRRGKRADGPNAVTSGAVLAEIVILLWVYFWVRRRVPLLLKGVRERTIDNMRHGAIDVGRNVLRWTRVIENVYRPVLLMLLLWLIWRALPKAAQGQLEVALLFYCIIWLASANLLIHFIDAIFGGAEAARNESIATLRLRSLRLVGRTGAYIGLSLSLASRLVGEGTIYEWVLKLTWILILPAILLLCYWWRPTVMDALSKERRKTALHEWILSHQKGLVGLIATGVGGCDYLRMSWSRIIRQRADEFVLAQRIGAYLFQRELDRRAEEEEQLALKPLSEDDFGALRSSIRPVEIIETAAKDDCAPLRKALEKKRGGVFALVGERGAGKTTQADLLSRSYSTLIIECQDTLPELQESLSTALGLDATLSLRQLIEQLAHDHKYDLVILDGAHRLIHPWIGGIASFDELVTYIRPHSDKMCFLCTFEDAVWNFFEGARGVQPTFDQVMYLNPWSEGDIRKFLESRSKAQGIDPNFRLLVSQLPKDADAIDWAEALEKAKKSYFRLIWDYAAGNPAIALHMWRRSLAKTSGGVVYVQLFQPPRAEDIEMLPDTAAFVVRAIVQLGFATKTEIFQVTRLSDRVILDTVRFGMVLGMIDEGAQGYRITWSWYRAVSRFLQRRHLLSVRFLRRAGA